MLMSQLFVPTLREVPAEAESPSHKLMLRAGLIRKLASGIYEYLPLGYKVIKKVEEINRAVFDASGAQELLMPAMHPIELWQETGRDKEMGEVLLRLTDRTNRQFCLGPTHEEVITEIARAFIKSYKQLPVALYQIQTKFRDEPRPRGGLIRAKEFIMKDMYSFHSTQECLDKFYERAYQSYIEIFKRCGLETKAVLADSGPMGGDVCHEFMISSPLGEDKIFVCSKCDYNASEAVADFYSKEKAVSKKQPLPLEEIATPEIKTIQQLVEFLGEKSSNFIKAIIYNIDKDSVIVLVRGDHEINESRLRKFLKTSILELATPEEILELTGGPMGFSGPVGLKDIQIIADVEVKYMKNSITGANKADTHLKGVNLNRDFKADSFAKLRNAEDGDLCPECKGELKLERGIELGHIFKLGTKYSESMKALFLDKDGIEQPLIMGCYGIGITRIVSAVIEQHHDRDGIIWPMNVAPFKVIVIPVLSNVKEQLDKAQKIYDELRENNIEVVLDDRSVRPGVKFKDADLIGFPIKIVVGEKAIKENKIEVKLRSEPKAEFMEFEDIVQWVLEKVG